MIRNLACVRALAGDVWTTCLAQAQVTAGAAEQAPGVKKAEANRNSSGAGGLGGTSGAGTGGMTNAPGDGTSTSKALATDEPSRPQRKGPPNVPDAKNKEKREWE